MSQTGYLNLGISIIAALLIIFVVSFVMYIKTPVPEGCKDIKINNENCASCSHKECSFYPGEK